METAITTTTTTATATVDAKAWLTGPEAQAKREQALALATAALAANSKLQPKDYEKSQKVERAALNVVKANQRLDKAILETQGLAPVKVPKAVEQAIAAVEASLALKPAEKAAFISAMMAKIDQDKRAAKAAK